MVVIKDMEMPKSCYECDLHNYHNCDLTNDGIEKYLDDVKHPNCPLVEIEEREVGKWEYDAYKDKSGGHCNQCGHFLRYGEKTNFCPDCGADMRGSEE